jgi:hypothetical protein
MAAIGRVGNDRAMPTTPPRIVRRVSVCRSGLMVLSVALTIG